ncbi:MAG TPA: SufD family Fe-S cluster assembly protein [Candidatus Babeliales bacterium]|nr:SufD family Fe-S cluster assembly protein [Candidatus Babeliales bacterium]
MSYIVEYYVAENQQAHYSFLFDETIAHSPKHMRFVVERNAIMNVEILIARTPLNIHIECILQGEGADARIAGIYMGHMADAITITTMQHHKACHTRSNLVMKGILHDTAWAHYQGNVRIEQDAHGTVASQENKNILLSNAARAVSVPSLEVLNHDVQCSHGSAIGKFDEEQILYAAARGIDEKTAQHLLLQAFCADLFTDEKLKKQMSILLESYI